MFFKKKKETKALLYKENILVDCTVKSQEEAIRTMGQMLVDTGYVETPYIEAMLEREKTYSTYMGNGLALPHGVEAAKKEVKASGIAVMVFKDGILWGEEMAKIVIGIAGVGEEHLEILGLIAEKMMDEETAKQLTTGDAGTIYSILTQ
ncbi:MAG: PTS sugar transporter subunit IIA [Lachnospiraceae bacterium]